MKYTLVSILFLFLFTNVTPAKDRQLDSLFEVGNINLYNGSYDAAFNDFFARKILSEKLNDSLNLAQSLTYLGEVCRATKQFDLGMNYLNEALSLGKAILDSFTIAKALNRMSAIKYEQKEVAPAVNYAKQALEIFRNIHEENLSANTLNILGALATSKKDYTTAVEYYDQARQIMLRLPDQSDLPNILNNIANNYFLFGQFEKGLPYAQQSFELATKNKTRVYILEACRMLTRGYEGLNRFSEALIYSKMAAGINEDLINEYKDAEKATIELKHQNELTTKENVFLKQINDENQRVLKIQRMLFWITTGGLLLLSGFLLTLIVLYRQRKENLKILRERNLLVENQKMELQQLNHLKDNLLAIISHDYRAPLIGLHAMMEMFDMETEPKEDFNEITHRMKKRINETIETLDNMILWTRTQMQGAQVKKKALALRQLVAELEKYFSSQSTKDITIRNDVPQMMVIDTDRDMLKIILRNLLSNAIKFSHPGSVITVNSDLVGDFVKISVHDNGTGIKPDVRSKLFTNEHVSTVGTGYEKGIGMGLILTNELVTILKGRIEIESEADLGSSFNVTIPLN